VGMVQDDPTADDVLALTPAVIDPVEVISA
jgi:hypothetical protein